MKITVNLSKLQWTDAQAYAVFANLRHLHRYIQNFYFFSPTVHIMCDIPELIIKKHLIYKA